MRNIKFSGLKGQALSIGNQDIPSIKEFKDAIPNHFFKFKTSTSLKYLLQSVLIQLIVVIAGLSIPFTPRMIPIWIIYALISGTTAMGFWVIAHECGHGAFSRNKTLEKFLEEKQKLRFNYGFSEKQLINYVRQAKKFRGATGSILLQLLEMRLDNLIFRKS